MAAGSSGSQSKAPTKEVDLLEISILKLPDLPLKGSTLKGETLGKPFGPCLDVSELFKPMFVWMRSFQLVILQYYRVHLLFNLVTFPKRRIAARSLASSKLVTDLDGGVPCPVFASTNQIACSIQNGCQNSGWVVSCSSRFYPLFRLVLYHCEYTC